MLSSLSLPARHGQFRRNRRLMASREVPIGSSYELY